MGPGCNVRKLQMAVEQCDAKPAPQVPALCQHEADLHVCCVDGESWLHRSDLRSTEQREKVLSGPMEPTAHQLFIRQLRNDSEYRAVRADYRKVAEANQLPCWL